MPPPSTPYQPYAALHEHPNGSDDQRPTAMQILQEEGLREGDQLKGKTFLITGCSSGLGIETARALYATGADVFMTVRPSKSSKGEEVLQGIKASVPEAKGRLELILLDLASQESVRDAAKDFLNRSRGLNVLICNAGVMMCPYSLTSEGFEMHMASNHFGHFLLFHLLKDLLLSSATPEFNSRVVIVSSAGHRFSPIRFDDMNFARDGYNSIFAYGQSKTANIYMASSIERRYGHKNLHASSVHPGVILDTELPRYQTNDSLDSDFDMAQLLPLMKSVAQGAATQVWAATAGCFNGRGSGHYLADCGECAPFVEGSSVAAAGYGLHAYDDEAEEKLWKLSCEAVGTPIESSS